MVISNVPSQKRIGSDLDMDMVKHMAIFTKKKIRPCISFDPQKKHSISSPVKEDQQKSQKSSIFSKDDSTFTFWRQVLPLLPVYLLELCYGMNSGFTAILTPQLYGSCSEFLVSLDQLSWIVSLDNILTPIICIMSGLLQQKYGPLRVLQFSCLPYIAAWISAALASSHYTLYFSRILVGISNGIVSTSIFTVEICSPDLRATFSMLESVLRCVGSVMVISFGLHWRWWQIATICPLIPLLALALALVTPESPVFSIKKGRYDEAEQSLLRVYGSDYDAKQDVINISENLHQLRQSKGRKSDYMRNLKNHPEVYKPFLIIVFVSIVQQFSGVSVIRAYSVAIFDTVFSNSSSHGGNLTVFSDMNEDGAISGPTCHHTSSMAYISAIVIGLCRLFSSLTLARILLTFSRRSMYFTSLILTIICLFMFSTFSYIISVFMSTGHDSKEVVFILQVASLLASCLLVISVQLGVQTLPLLLSGELFPADVRATCKGLTRAVTCLLLLLSIKMYPQLEHSLHLYGTFFMFGGVLFILLPISYLILPETKDISLENIEQHFRRKSLPEEEEIIS